MFKYAVVICALIACVAGKPGLLHAPLAAIPAPAPVVTAASSQVVARTFNGIAAAPIVAPVPVAPVPAPILRTVAPVPVAPAPVLRTLAAPLAAPIAAPLAAPLAPRFAAPFAAPLAAPLAAPISTACSHHQNCISICCSFSPSLRRSLPGQILGSFGLCPSTFGLCWSSFVVKKEILYSEPKD
nr:cyclin-dependent kinase inhibitor 1C [Drosophila bipectinata]